MVSEFIEPIHSFIKTIAKGKILLFWCFCVSAFLFADKGIEKSLKMQSIIL